jgi:hypothetical protein
MDHGNTNVGPELPRIEEDHPLGEEIARAEDLLPDLDIGDGARSP